MREATTVRPIRHLPYWAQLSMAGIDPLSVMATTSTEITNIYLGGNFIQGDVGYIDGMLLRFSHNSREITQTPTASQHGAPETAPSKLWRFVASMALHNAGHI